MPNTNSKDPSTSEEDESYLELLRMQRMFVEQIKREQELERERQCSMARLLGSVTTVNEFVPQTDPYLDHQTPPKARTVSNETIRSKRPLDTEPCDGEDASPKKSRRTFSKFDFDEIYFSVFEPEKKDQIKLPENGSSKTPLSVVEEDSDSEVEDNQIFDSIFRQEDEVKNGINTTPKANSTQNLVSIVTDDDETEDGQEDSDKDRHELDLKRWKPSEFDPLEWKPARKHNKTNSEPASQNAKDPTEIFMRFDRAMDRSSSSQEQIQTFNLVIDEDDRFKKLEESHAQAMSKTIESRRKLQALLKKQSLYAATA